MSFALSTLPAGSFALNGDGHLYCGGTATWDTTDTTKLSAITGGYELKGFTSGSITITGGSTTNEARGVGDGWALAAPGGRSASLNISCLRIIGDEAQEGLIAMATQSRSDWLEHGVAIAYGVEYTDTTDKLKGFGGVWILTDCSFEQSGGGDNDAAAETVSFTFSLFSNLLPINAAYTPST